MQRRAGQRPRHPVPLLGSLSMNQDQSAGPISINLAGSSSFTTGEGLVR